MREDIFPEVEVDKVPSGPPKPEDMPSWWPPDRPPQHLRSDMIYRGADGRWYRTNGSTVNRRDRRAAGVR